MRLDKYLAHATGFSRKGVKRVLHKKKITVNGLMIKDSAFQVGDADAVTFEKQDVSAPKPRYYMLNKPQGYVCSNDDSTNPTIAGLLSDEIRANELNIAGRLDLDTTGLLLITTDGKWLHKVTSPNHKQGKRYLVETAEPIDPSAIEKFSKGIELKGEKRLTKPATLEILETHMAYLTLNEGKYHQVKRMFGAIGNKVTELHRDRVGDIFLDNSLSIGEYRELTTSEIDSIH